jgi:uncharacterized protein HemX
MNEFDWLNSTLSAIGGGFAGWFFNRKQQRASTKTNELENVEKALSIYRDMINELKSNLKETKTQLEDINKNCVALDKEIVKMQKRCISTECPNFK